MSYCITVGCTSPQNPESSEFCQNCGSRLVLQNRYRPIKLLGRGGFGKTFLALDLQIPSQPYRVIKQFFFPDQNLEDYHKAAQLFRQEAIRLEQLGHHPQIPQLFAYFEQDQHLFLVQEYIPGETLFQQLNNQGVFQENQIWDLLRGLVPVLKFIHQHHIIHRDIKPANLICRSSENTFSPFSDLNVKNPEPEAINPLGTKIMDAQEQAQISKSIREQIKIPSPPLQTPKLDVSKLSPEGQIVLIDFGVAKILTGTALLKTGTIIGSPEFMAPEQTRGKVFPASDLYSVGATCLYLLTGVSPWNMYDVVQEKWTWRDFLRDDCTVSDRLGKILDKLVAPQLNQRFQAADQVLEALKPTSVKITPVKPVSKPQSPRKSAAFKLPNFLAKLQSKPSDQKLKDRLISARNIDYTPLQNLLASHQWKKADLETWQVLCQALGKRNKTYLYANDLSQLPKEELTTIDQLWVKYSEGRFGFSVQARIYQEVEEDYGAFCDRIGWLPYNTHNPIDGFKFKLSAPIGHLPSRICIIQSGKWWLHIAAIARIIVDG